MSTAAVSTSSIYQELQAYFQQRGSDLQQLGQSLQAGDLAGAQQEYNTIQALGQGGPFASGDPFKVSQRQQDFAAIGQALQAGDLAGAQQAFAQLQNSFHRHDRTTDPAPAVVVNLGASSAALASTSGSAASQPAPAASSSSAANGPEIIVNLGNAPAGEQITIGLNNTGNGTEQVTLSLSNQQNRNPEQITLNLNQNSNEQVILNLFNSTAASTAQSSGVSVTA